MSLVSALLIIPTYNERENIALIIGDIKKIYSKINILVVDDNSPDGTADVVIELQNKFENIHLLKREKKAGLGQAYRAGIDWARGYSYSRIIQMDADSSHRAVDLEKILSALDKFDFVVGSRRVPGGAVKNWEWYRRFLSWAGSFYASLLLGYNIKDWTGGFNGWNRRVLDRVDYQNCSSQGYSFQIEMKLKALRLNFSATEVPIIFEERRAGQSKMSFSIITEALQQVWYLRKTK
jgi:dolichol-phosphate mannosyltransferase